MYVWRSLGDFSLNIDVLSNYPQYDRSVRRLLVLCQFFVVVQH